MWVTEANERDVGEVLQSRPKARNLSGEEILKLHSYVLENSVAVAPLFEEYMELRTRYNRRRRTRDPEFLAFY